jgi:hypothetical protein
VSVQSQYVLTFEALVQTPSKQCAESGVQCGLLQECIQVYEDMDMQIVVPSAVQAKPEPASPR